MKELEDNVEQLEEDEEDVLEIIDRQTIHTEDNSKDKKEYEHMDADDFICPDDDFLRSIFPIGNKGLANLKKHVESAGGIKDRTPLINFGKDSEKNGYVCPGCETKLTKGTQFWISSSFIGNVHFDKKPRTWLCKKCMNEYYKKLLELYEGDHKNAMLHLCWDFDFYYDEYLIDKLMIYHFHDGEKNFFPETYLKFICDYGTQNPYKGKTFKQQIGFEITKQVLSGGYDYTGKQKELDEQRAKQYEDSMSNDDKLHRSKIISTYLYDPFENFPDTEKPKLYRSLFMMLDDTIAEDLPRQKAALEIVTAYQTVEQLNNKIQELIKSGDNSKEAADNIAKWSSVCSTKTSIIEKSARENGFSMRYAGAAGKGSGTLSGVQKELTEGFDDDIVTNYYDIKTSTSIKHIADISAQSMMEQLELNENDYTSMIKEQRQLIQQLQSENDKLNEELRLIRTKLNKGRLLRELRQEFIDKGLDTDEINMILEEEYTTPRIEGDLENGEE